MVCQERRGAPQLVVGCPEEVLEEPWMEFGFLWRILLAMVCHGKCEVVKLEEKMVGLGLVEDWS